MYGAILGDIVGSIWEKKQIPFNVGLYSKKSKFTDDTVLTIATMDALLNDKPYHDAYREYYRKYPDRGFGRGFREWAESDSKSPYNSYGNGAAMRVSPIGWFFSDEEEVLSEAERSSSVTHNHKDAIMAAKAVALSVYLARTTHDKQEVLDGCNRVGYEVDYFGLKEYHDQPFSSSLGTVPKAINCFFKSRTIEECLRMSLLCGGDVDTIASISCAIFEAHAVVIPSNLKSYCISKIEKEDFYYLFNSFRHKIEDINEAVFDFL